MILRELRAAEAEAPVVRGPLTGMAGGRSAAGAPPARRTRGAETDARVARPARAAR